MFQLFIYRREDGLEVEDYIFWQKKKKYIFLLLNELCEVCGTNKISNKISFPHFSKPKQSFSQNYFFLYCIILLLLTSCCCSDRLYFSADHPPHTHLVLRPPFNYFSPSTFLSLLATFLHMLHLISIASSFSSFLSFCRLF